MSKSVEPSPLEQPERRAEDDKARRLWYPLSEWSTRVDGDKLFRALVVVIEPVPPLSELPLVVADLSRNLDVSLEPLGRIRHDRRCPAADHELPRELRGLFLSSASFIAEATFESATADPAVRIVQPEISPATYPGHPHFYPNGVVCPVFPADRTWSWEQPVADYLDQVAIWLLKTLIWAATARLGVPVWIGADVHISFSR